MPETSVNGVEPSANPVPDRWRYALDLACQLTVDISLPGFKVVDLLALRPQSIVRANWQVGADVPLRVNGQLIAWAEFEVVGSRLAVRITELA